MIPLRPTPYSKDYEITDAMFGAFRSPGGMPFFWKLFGWGTLLISVILLLASGPILSSYVDLIRVSAIVESNPDAASKVFGTLGKFSLVWTLVMIGYGAVIGVIRAAFFRGYFFGDTGGTFPFKFGADELRQGLSWLGFFVVFMIVTIVVMTVLMVPLFLIIFTVGGESMALLVLGMVIAYFMALVAMIWCGVKLSPAGALTAFRGKTHILAARHVSKNRFWVLFGSILVAGLIGYVVSYVAFVTGILMAFSGLAGGDIFTIMTGTDPEATLEALERASETASFKISSVFAILLTSAGYSFYILILAGPQAYFTRQWAESGAANDDASGRE